MIFVYIAIYIEGASLLCNDVCVHSQILKELLYCLMMYIAMYIAIYIEGASLLCNDVCVHSYIY